MLLLVYTMYIIYIYFLLFSQNNGKNSRDLHAAINLHAIHGCDVITDSQKKNCCTGIPLKFFTPIMKMNTKEDIHKAMCTH